MAIETRRSKIGPSTTPGGANGDNALQNILDTTSSLGPLAAGWYTLETTVDSIVLQCNKTYHDTNPTAATIRELGVHVPPLTEVEFSVEGLGDQYLIWCTYSDLISDGILRVNDRNNSKK